MKSLLSIDTEMYPPFDGFPREGIAFLRKLKKNNNRKWFAEHKSEYEDLVKLPMYALISSLKAPVSEFAPEIEINPRKNMFRIYRDTRFSSDKTPYKTDAAGVFHLRGHWQESAGYYLQIGPGGVYVGGGIYMPNGSQLKEIRSAIAGQPEDFRLIVENINPGGKYRFFEGERLTRAPLGFPKDHPMIEWIKYKSYYTGVEWDENVCYTKKFADKVVGVYKDLKPLIDFLNTALKKYKPKTDRRK